MIKILSMNPLGIDGIRTIMTFEFTFDNPNELPKGGVYTMNQVIYLIANNSIAINNIDNSVYKFNGKQWIKTGDKITPNNMNNITSNGNYILSSSPTSTNTNVSVNVEGEESILIDKTITENGTYLPAEDEATAYSKIVANVPPHFSEVRAFLPAYDGVSESIVILDSSDGNYILDNNTAPNEYFIYRNCLISPASSIKMKITGTAYVAFTPAESFDVNNITIGTQQLTITGDTVTPGDGKLYYLKINGVSKTGAITKYSINDYTYWVTINPES